MELLAVRHGQASFGAENYDALSPLGHRQARLLGEWLGAGWPLALGLLLLLVVLLFPRGIVGGLLERLEGRRR
jgi:ABC-type branched-subunit amino acid transport system permease subunit